jgi:hypothetical protein
VLELVGIALSLGIAGWEHQRARRAERKLDATLGDLPRQLATQISSYQKRLEPPASEHGSSLILSSYADLDGDGTDELLVEFPAGAHGSALAVFGFRNFNLELIGELGVGTPSGFWVEDFDNDGRLEVGTAEADYSFGLPYVLAPRYTIWYRLTDKGFVQVGENRSYSEEELADIRKHQAELNGAGNGAA